MNFLKKNLATLSILLLVLILAVGLVLKKESNETEKLKEIKGTVVSIKNNKLKIKNNKNTIYTFNYSEKENDLTAGQKIVIEYSGVLNKSGNDIISYKVLEDTNNIPENYKDSGIFSDYYQLAYDYLNSLSLEEKIGQLLLVRFPDTNQLLTAKKYNFAGYILFARDIQGKTKQEVIDMITSIQKEVKTPMLFATDEEGGTVVRVSSNPNIRDSKFLSPQALYEQGGFDLIKSDTIEKSRLLSSLGINVNLAPVADVSTTPTDYIYARSFGKDTAQTKEYIKTVITASKTENVSYTLKHFPGYSNNTDTHTGIATSAKSYNDILTEDIPPFEEGIKSGAEAVLVSHNIMTNIESNVPASLSPRVNELLRNTLKFTGVSITDDLDMQGVKTYSTTSVVVDALKAGNNLLIVTDYETSVADIKTALDNGSLTIDDINKRVFKTIAWKYYKLLFASTTK